MSERRYRSYMEQFKLEALALLEKHEKSAGQIERELGITPGLLVKWRARYQAVNHGNGNVHLEPSDLEDGQRQFDLWREIYNTQRPHEALGMQPPSRVYVPSPRPFPAYLPPIEYEPEATVRMTDCCGRLQYQGQRFRIGKAFRDSLVALRPTHRDGVWDVYFCKQRIAQINLAPHQT